MELPPSQAAASVAPEATYLISKICLGYELQRHGQARKKQPIKPSFKGTEQWGEPHLKQHYL